MLKKTAFFSFVLGFAITACAASATLETTGAGGAGGKPNSSSSSSSITSGSSSSGSGPIEIKCNGEPVLVGPIDGDIGLPYYENDVYACRQFGPGSYTRARIAWGIEAPCQSPPFGTWTIAPTNSVSEFQFAELVDLSNDEEFDISASVDQGFSLFVCAVLFTYSHENRSCLYGCKSSIDLESYWGDTDIDGFTISPPLLEPLYTSPTPDEATQLGNDLIRLMIEAR